MSATPDRTAAASAVFAAALAFGLTADVLSRTVPARLDVALGVGALVLLLVVLMQYAVALAPGVPVLGVPLGLLTVALVWRDSPTLFALNLLGIAGLTTLAVCWSAARERSRAAVAEYMLGAVKVAGGATAGVLSLVLADIDWRRVPLARRLRTVRGAAVGLAAAVPVVTVFGGLLMDADPVFGRLVTDAFAVRLEAAVRHGLTIVAWAWMAAGLLRALLLGGQPAPSAGQSADALPPEAARVAGTWSAARVPGLRFRSGEVEILLGATDLLFLAFVAVQFRYLFGGSELVRGLTDLTYAEYARSGFFQLVAVVALSLPLLLITDASLDRREPRTVRRYRALAFLMLLLLNVMLASALFRMRLYTIQYGVTELRFYTIAFMGWLALVLGWFGATVLRERRLRFAPGAAAGGYLVLLALNLLNPDGLIARINAGRALEGGSFDAAYAAQLSADALPTLRRVARSLPAERRSELAVALARRWPRELERGARWNISLASARRALGSRRPS